MINREKTHRVEGSHWVSPVNFEDEVTGGLEFPDPLGLIDSTLRKTNYTAGTTVTTDGFLRIAAALDEVGVQHESLNLDWWGDDVPNFREFEMVKEVLAGGFGFTCNVYADTLLGTGDGPARIDPRSTVDLLQSIGAKVVAPGIVQASSPEAEARQRDQLEMVVEYAHSVGLDVTITLAQVGRRDFDGMIRSVNHALTLGVQRFDLMDSTSSLSPEAMRVFIRRFRALMDRQVPISMHAHDDFGMGTASAIAAAGAGAAPDVSVNSVSYRCGFAPLEEVVLSLEVLYGVDTGIKVDKLQWLSDVVAEESGIPLPPLKPVTGGYAYLKSTAMDVLNSLRDGVKAFPPISGCVHADVTGADVRWVWDRLSTRASVRQLATNLGLTLTEAEVEQVYGALNRAIDEIAAYPKWLEPARAEQVVRSTVAAGRARGLAVETAPGTEAQRRAGLAKLGALPADQARELLHNCCPWDAVVDDLGAALPLDSPESLDAALEKAILALPAQEVPILLSLHPQIGVDSGAKTKEAGWSRAEESGVRSSATTLLDEIIHLGDTYAAHFGYTYVVSAPGLSGEQIRDDLTRRLANDPVDELEYSRIQLAVICRSRMQRTLRELGSAE